MIKTEEFILIVDGLGLLAALKIAMEIMMTNRRDIYGDGHGFVNVPVGRKRDVTPYRYTYDTNFPSHSKPFLGLYDSPEGRYSVIIWRANRVIDELQFITRDGAAPHYIPDPIAWAELPEQ
jgi:hypothetical protein